MTWLAGMGLIASIAFLGALIGVFCAGFMWGWDKEKRRQKNKD